MCDLCGWEEFLDNAEQLLADVEELPDRAEDFADSVKEKVEGMVDWARDNEHVTGPMETALDNMAAGVARWQR